jgi:hypothetical protein
VIPLRIADCGLRIPRLRRLARSGRCFPWARLALWTACLLLLWGCGAGGPLSTRPALDAQELIRILQTDDPRVQTLQAFGSLKWDRAGDKGSVDHALMIARPGSMRIEALAPLGGTSMFSMVIRRGEVEMYAPSESRAYRGPASVSILERLFALPLKVNEALGVLCGRVPLCPVERASVSEEAGLVLLDVACQAEGWQERIRLDPARLDPVGLNLLDPSGQVVLSVSWSGYRQFGDTRVPMEIQAEMPMKGSRLNVRLKDVEINAPIPGDKFQIVIPPDIEIKPLT